MPCWPCTRCQHSTLLWVLAYHRNTKKFQAEFCLGYIRLRYINIQASTDTHKDISFLCPLQLFSLYPTYTQIYYIHLSPSILWNLLIKENVLKVLVRACHYSPVKWDASIINIKISKLNPAVASGASAKNVQWNAILISDR